MVAMWQNHSGQGRFFCCAVVSNSVTLNLKGDAGMKRSTAKKYKALGDTMLGDSFQSHSLLQMSMSVSASQELVLQAPART